MNKEGIIKALAIVMIVLPLLTISQENQAAYASKPSAYVEVMAPDLNVRTSPDISAKTMGLVHQGETFKVIQTKNRWEQIQLSNSQIGWVYEDYIQRITPDNIKEATVEAIQLNVREAPSLTSTIVGNLKLGTKIRIFEEEAKWVKMVSTSGVQGWVYQYYLTKGESDSLKTQSAASPSSYEQTSSSFPSDGNTQDQAVQTEKMPNRKEPLKGKTIVLDPGHGGVDSGTTSITGTHEKALTLSIAKVVEQKLKNTGAHVLMTRPDDTYISLEQRANLSNQNHADAFISFHYNWSNDPSAKGLTDFYYQKSKDDSLAENILNEVAKQTKLNNAGSRFDDLSVLRNNSQPSTLIELGFLSNKQDDAVVEHSDYLENVAQGVYLGLLEYFAMKP